MTDRFFHIAPGDTVAERLKYWLEHEPTDQDRIIQIDGAKAPYRIYTIKEPRFPGRLVWDALVLQDCRLAFNDGWRVKLHETRPESGNVYITKVERI